MEVSFIFYIIFVTFSGLLVVDHQVVHVVAVERGAAPLAAPVHGQDDRTGARRGVPAAPDLDPGGAGVPVDPCRDGRLAVGAAGAVRSRPESRRVAERTRGDLGRAARRDRTRRATTPRAAPPDRRPIPRPGAGDVLADPGAPVRRRGVHRLATRRTPRRRNDHLQRAGGERRAARAHAVPVDRTAGRARGLTIAVQDHRPGRIRRPAVDATNLRGLGLFVVDRLSRSWGTSPTGDGKKVWALLPTPSSPTPSSPTERPSQ